MRKPRKLIPSLASLSLTNPQRRSESCSGIHERLLKHFKAWLHKSVASLPLLSLSLVGVDRLLSVLQAADKGSSRKRYEPSDKDRQASPPAKRINLSPDRGEPKGHPGLTKRRSSLLLPRSLASPSQANT